MRSGSRPLRIARAGGRETADPATLFGPTTLLLLSGKTEAGFPAGRVTVNDGIG